MIKIYTRITNFKNDNGKSDNPNYSAPTHYVEISTQDDYNDKVTAGDLWTKSFVKDGNEVFFTSGQLKNGREYTKKNGEKAKEGEFVILNVGVEQAKKILQVYKDYLIQQREPGYPTPTSQGIDLSKTLQPDPAFDITPEHLDIDPNDIPFNL